MHMKFQPDLQGADELTHRGQDKMDAISRTTFLNAFSSMKMFEFRFRFHWSLFLRVQCLAWHWPGDKPLSEPMMARLPMHICVTLPQWVKGLSQTSFLSPQVPEAPIGQASLQKRRRKSSRTPQQPWRRICGNSIAKHGGWNPPFGKHLGLHVLKFCKW